MPVLSAVAIMGAIAAQQASEQKKAAKRQHKQFLKSLPKPDAPLAQGRPGEGATDIQKKFIKAGRGGNILTGQLAPEKVGKKRLLG